MRPRAHILESECRQQVQVALRACGTSEVARASLAQQGFNEAVTELALVNATTLAELETTNKPVVAVLNHPNLIHFAWLSEAPADIEHAMASAIASPAARKHWPLRGVWRHYGDMIGALALGREKPLEPSARIQGSEAYMLPYIAYLSASTDEARATASRQIEMSRAARLKDKRFTDWYSLDGDSSSPTKWDFRLCSAELWANKRFHATADKAGRA